MISISKIGISDKSNSSKQVRWRKQKDKRLAKLVIHSIQGDIPKSKLNENLTINELTYFHSLKITSMEKFHEVVSGLLLKKIYKIMKWKGTQKALIERIAYVFNSPLKLSSRDFKSLRKQYYIMVKNNTLDWASICNVYPEKDPHYIIET